MPKRNHRRALEQLRLKLKLLGDPPPPTEPDGNAAWAAEAVRSRQAVRAAREVYDRFPKSPEAKHAYDAAVKRYLEAANRVTPPRVIEGWERLRLYDPRGLTFGLEYLEDDPWNDQSWRAKDRLIRFITRMEIPADLIPRFQQVVLTVVDSRDRCNFRSYCRLARHVDGAPLRDALAARLKDPDAGVRQHAQWVLTALDHPGPRPPLMQKGERTSITLPRSLSFRPQRRHG